MLTSTKYGGLAYVWQERCEIGKTDKSLKDAQALTYDDDEDEDDDDDEDEDDGEHLFFITDVLIADFQFVTFLINKIAVRLK